MKTKLTLITGCLYGIFLLHNTALGDIGSTTVSKWKDNKRGAYTLRFDDSMMSHIDHTIPNLVERGLVGSFFINPASNRYGYGIDTWESLASRTGIELCPHTMNHIGAGDYEEADYEIGEAFRKVWGLNPPDKSKLYPFNRGGGTEWPTGYRETIQSKYPVADYSGESVRYGGEDNKEELIAFAKKAMDDDAWHTVLTHGTGPNLEWLGFEVSNFEALLDYLASVKDRMWVGNAGDIYKYVMERKSAQVVQLNADEERIRLELTSEVDEVLFDYPLTLVTEVPDNWQFCHVQQGPHQGIYPVSSGKVMYEALPNRGEITLSTGKMDESAPGQVVVNDGASTDIDMSFSTKEISANWEAAQDPESGISRYWYKIGTTPGGSEVLDWIDNGLSRSFTTSRTNLYLTRGEKYYVTIKAVNGVGLSSESTSDGFQVERTSDYLFLNEDFNNGYLSQWDVKQTRDGSDKNILYITDLAGRNGGYGLQCHLQEGQGGRPFLTKQNIPESQEVFTSFYLKFSADFKLPSERGNMQILELRDGSDEVVAQVFVGFLNDIGFHIYALARDNTGYNASLPGLSASYPLSYVPVKANQWIRVDLRTVAHESEGGAELWVNGVREGCITNRFTEGKAVSSMSVGILRSNSDIYSGDFFIDDITVSDSYLK